MFITMPAPWAYLGVAIPTGTGWIALLRAVWRRRHLGKVILRDLPQRRAIGPCRARSARRKETRIFGQDRVRIQGTLVNLARKY